MKVLVNDSPSSLDCSYEYSLASYPTEGSILVGINIFSILLGISGNLLVCMAVWTSPTMNQSSFHHFISSLAVADLIDAFIAQPLLVLLISGRMSSMCLFAVHYTFRLVANVALVALQLTLVLIALDRCLLVSGKFNYRNTMTERKKVALIIVWFLACLHSAIRDTVFEHISLVLNAVLVVFYGSYAFIFYKVYKHGKHLPKCRQGKGRRNTVVIGINVKAQNKLTKEIQVALTIVMILVCFTISWVPLFYLNLTQPGRHYGLQYYRMKTCSFFALSFNPLLYCFSNTKYRQAYREFCASFLGVAWKKTIDKPKGTNDSGYAIQGLKLTTAV